jgi:translocation and assembly module TamB
LNIAIRHWDVTDGIFELDDRTIPLNLRGEGLVAKMNYDAAASWYTGELRSDRLRILFEGIAPFEVSASTTFNIERSRIALTKVTIVAKDSRAELTGTLENPRAPRGSFKVKAALQTRDAVRMFDVPLKPVGSGTFDGVLNIAFVKPFSFSLEGKASGRGLAYSHDKLNIEGAEASGDVRVSQAGFTVSKGTLEAMGAEVHGDLSFADWKEFHVEGTVDSLNARQAAMILTEQSLPWDGTLRGEFSLDTTMGKPDTTASANLSILPVSGGNSLDGLINASYSQPTGLIALGESYLATPSSRLELSGTLGQTLKIKFNSRNLDDLLPALALADNAPKTIPLKLAGGNAEADGTVTGPLENPVFRGHVLVARASLEGHAFDQFDANVEASKVSLRSDKFTLTRGDTKGSGAVTLQARAGSFDNAAIAGNLAVTNVSIEEALKEVGRQAPITGLLAGSATFTGTVKQPEGTGTLDIQHPTAYGEKADRIRATLHMGQDIVELTGGQVEDGAARVRFSGSYRHPAGNFEEGDARFQVTGQELTPDRFEALSKLQPALGGNFAGTLDGAGHVQNSKFVLTSANGNLSVDKFTVDKQPVGNLKLTAATRGDELQVQVNGSVRESMVSGDGSWRLTGNNPGSVTVRFSRMNVQSVHSLAMLGGTNDQESSDLPFDGFIEGHATATLPLAAPADFQAEVTLDAVQLRPKVGQTPKSLTQVNDIELHNTKPVVLALTAKNATIRSAQFSGRDTTIEATGSVPFETGANADFGLRGDLNLTILQLLSPDLMATGKASMQATVRGALRDPSVIGRMELKGASIYFGDLPNGVDNANGVVLFDRRRATIESLTAETGGGKITLTGLVEFGTSIVYRLQADAKSVRVRWPEDLSTTFDAKLALNGTSDQSTLSGSLTLNRATFNSRGDLSSMFAASTKPIPTTGQPNDLLRGAQFDIRIESSPNFEFQTSLTRDVEGEVSLRLRGSPLRPVLLGDISVNQGEVQLLGNRYTVNRGDIHFLNPVKIEPNLDLEMETKARGITVNVNLSGTMDKLKVNYSSDPPMQPNEIIALLAVGRDPSGASTIAAGSPAAGGTSGFSDTGLGLLGEAASEQLSSRLQRFIGSSRVKIDPTLTAIDNLPQARLTVEQQISRDITLTYITNLNRTQEQIVRVQWDFSRKWSAIAIRDSNGLFGIDFQYRRRF